MQKVVSIPGSMVNIKESMGELKSMTPIGFWRSFGDSPDSRMK
jgi:hypothetical protein